MGFTTIELLVAIAMVVATLAIAVPSLRGIVDDTSGNLAARELISDLHVARMQAIRHGRNATVTFNAPGARQYTITWNNPVQTRVVDMSARRAGVMFENNPPGATTPAPVGEITFTPQGFGPVNGANIYLNDQNDSEVIRIQVTFAGAISEMRYSPDADDWILR